MPTAAPRLAAAIRPKTFCPFGSAPTHLEAPAFLATGAVDATTWGSAADGIDMSFHEVTGYWIRSPKNLPQGAWVDTFIMNSDVWNDLDEDLKAIFERAVNASSHKGLALGTVADNEAWVFLEDYGIEIIEWPSEDIPEFNRVWKSILLEQEFDDPAAIEILEVMGRYLDEMGY